MGMHDVEIGILEEKIEKSLQEMKEVKKQYRDAVKETNLLYGVMREREEEFYRARDAFLVVYGRRKKEDEGFAQVWDDYEKFRRRTNDRIRELKPELAEAKANQKKYYDLVTKYTHQGNLEAKLKCLEKARAYKAQAKNLSEELSALKKSISQAKEQAEGLTDGGIDLREARVLMESARIELRRSTERFDDARNHRNELKAKLNEMNVAHQFDVNELWELYLKRLWRT